MSPRESVDVESTIGAPVAAVEGDDQWTRSQELRERHEPPCFVGQDEFGYRLAELRGRKANAVIRETRDHPLYDGGE